MRGRPNSITTSHELLRRPGPALVRSRRPLPVCLLSRRPRPVVGLLSRRPRPVGAGCGASVGRSCAERADCAAVLGLAAHCATHCAPFGRSVQTSAMKVLTNALRAGRKPCAPYMDASRVAREISEVLTLRVNCGLISGLLVQAGLSPTAGPDGDSRGRSSSRLRASHKACPRSATALPTHGLTALPSLLRLLSRTGYGVCHVLFRLRFKFGLFGSSSLRRGYTSQRLQRWHGFPLLVKAPAVCHQGPGSSRSWVAHCGGCGLASTDRAPLASSVRT